MIRRDIAEILRFHGIYSHKVLNITASRRSIVAILALAAFLRLLGIWHDYPNSFYPDEVHFVKRALSFGSFDFNPHWFHKPAFYMYLLFFEYGAYFLAGKLAGLWDSVTGFAVAYIKNPGPFYMIGRFTTFLFSMGSIWMTYIMGERHFKQGVGLAAALLLTLSYGHAVSGQEIKADTPAMFFAIASMFFLLNYLKGCNVRDLFFASILAGIGTATKKYPIVMLVPIMASIILVHRDKPGNLILKIRKTVCYMGMSCALFYLMYFICAPYGFLDPLGRKSTFGFVFQLFDKVHQLFSNEQAYHPANFIDQKAGLLQGFLQYFRVFVHVNGTGMIIGSLEICGILYMFSRFDRNKMIFLLFPVAFAITSVFTYPGYSESRHQLPLYPYLAIAGGSFIVALAGNKGLRNKIVTVSLLIGLIFPLYRIMERDIYISKQDTRNIAQRWIESNISSGAKMLVDENGPQLFFNDERLRKDIEPSLKADKGGQFTAHYGTYLNYQLLAAGDVTSYYIDFIRLPWWREREEQPGVYYATSQYDRDMGNPLRPVGVMPYEYYRDNGYQYVVVISDMYNMFLEEDSGRARNFPSFHAFYRTLFKKGLLIKEFNPDQDSKGPEVKIFMIT